MDQDEKENIRTEKPRCEMSELTADESNLLTLYRAMSEADRGYIRHISQAFTHAQTLAAREHLAFYN